MRPWNFAILAALTIGPCASNPATGKIRLEESETRLGQLPYRMQSASVRVTPDGRRSAFVVKRGWRVAVVIDGVESNRLYDWVVESRIQFTPDGKHAIFQVKKGQQVALVIDGTEGKPYDVLDAPVFSPRGNHVAYAGKRNGRYVAVLNGAEQAKLYDDVRSVTVADAGRLAYAATEKQKVCCVVDGIEGTWYDEVADVRQSADGKRVGYRARLKELWTIVVDGKEGEWHEQVTPVVFSETGDRFGYFAAAKGTSVCVIDGKPSPASAPRALAGPVFSGDGKHAVHTGTADWQEFIVLDGKAGNVEAGTFRSHVFSPGEKPRLFSVLSRREDVQSVVIDGAAQKSYGRIHSIAFSPDGKRYAYVAERGPRRLVVVDGEESETFDSIEPGSLCFSGDSKHVSYIAQGPGGFQAVIDGVAGREYESIAPQEGMRFAEDGTLNFIAAKSTGTGKGAGMEQEREMELVKIKMRILND